MYQEPIETPEEILEYTANELDFDNICFYAAASDLEFCMQHHHRNLDKLPDYLYIMLMKILNKGGIPYIDDINQMVNNDKEKTAQMLVNKWLTERDDPDWNGIWFYKQA